MTYISFIRNRIYSLFYLNKVLLVVFYVLSRCQSFQPQVANRSHPPNSIRIDQTAVVQMQRSLYYILYNKQQRIE